MYLERNLNLIANRWPQLAKQLLRCTAPAQVQLIDNTPDLTLMINGVHLSSCYDRLREARIQAELVPGSSSRVHVYGLATGDLPRVLLARPQLKHLTLVLMNPQVAKASLTHLDHSDWLADDRVQLLTAATEKVLRFPFACAPACLYLADDGSARLRDLLHLELATPFIQAIHRGSKDRYLARIEENEAFISKDADVTELFCSFPKGNIVVAGAGPTLSDHYGWLTRKRDHFTLIAVDVSVRSLLTAGIIPDVVVSIDASPKLFDKAFGGIDMQRLLSGVLVYFPLVDHRILSCWPGRRFVAYSQGEIYEQICQRYPRGKLYSSGSVIHPALDLAVKSGAARVFLLGTDFSFPGGRSHVAGAGVSAHTAETSDWVLSGKGQRVPTTPNFRGYLRDLETYIALHPEIEFINGSVEGAKIEGTKNLNEVTGWNNLT